MAESALWTTPVALFLDSKRALEELEFFSRELRILGVYPAHPFRAETQNER